MPKDYGREMREIAHTSWSYARRALPGKAREWVGLFRYFPTYVRAVCKQWASILFGESVLAVAFLIWWSLGSPPLAVIFTAAVLVAGFFAWCGEYRKSVAKFTISGFVIQQTPIYEHVRIVQSAIRLISERAYIQLIPKCLTDSPVSGCEGSLIRVFVKDAGIFAGFAGEKLQTIPVPLNLT